MVAEMTLSRGQMFKVRKIDELKQAANLPISLICKLTRVSESTYYSWRRLMPGYVKGRRRRSGSARSLNHG